MRTIQVSEITEQIAEMCIEANYSLTPDMVCGLETAKER